MSDREDLMTTTLVELADTLVGEYDLLEYLDLLLARCAAVLRADAGGVMLASDVGHETRLQLLASTDHGAQGLELLQLHHEQGPCIDCYRLGELVVEHDLARTQLWPAFSPAAVELGYRSVVAVPMRLRGEVIGGLNLFLGEPGAAVSGVSGAGKEDLRAAQALADMATIGILQQRAVREAQEVADQLRVALDTRIVIEQAKGIVSAQLDLGLDESYQVMRWFGRNHNLVLREVATAVVTGQLSPTAIRSPQ